MLYLSTYQAHDTVVRDRLYEAMVELGALETQSFKVANSLKQGERQGDLLLPILFNLALETIKRNSEINREGLLFHKRHQCLAFADDLMLLARSRHKE